METGRKILNLRRDRELAQKTLAEMSSVTPSALSRIEKGTHQPRAPVAFEVARALGVTVDYLLDENAPYPPPERELIANLPRPEAADEPGERIDVTRTEKRLLMALRELDADRRELLATVLDAPRDRVHETLSALVAPRKTTRKKATRKNPTRKKTPKRKKRRS